MLQNFLMYVACVCDAFFFFFFLFNNNNKTTQARRETYDEKRRPRVLMQELTSPRQLTEEELFLDRLSSVKT